MLWLFAVVDVVAVVVVVVVCSEGREGTEGTRRTEVERERGSNVMVVVFAAMRGTHE